MPRDTSFSFDPNCQFLSILNNKKVVKKIVETVCVLKEEEEGEENEEKENKETKLKTYEINLN